MPKIGVFCHMHYRDQYLSMRDYLMMIPYEFDLYLSTSSPGNADYLRELFAPWPRVTIELVPNRGRDVAPKLVTFRDAHAKYDYVLWLHTKGSYWQWRAHILDTLISTPSTVAAIIEKFEAAPRLGVIAAEHWPPIIPWVNWCFNKPLAKQLATRAGIKLTPFWRRSPLPDTIDFPSGTMFWARPAALRPLLDLNLTFDEFPPEPIGRDGTIAHALERMIYLSAIHAGYQWTTVTVTDNGFRQKFARPTSRPARSLYYRMRRQWRHSRARLPDAAPQPAG
jgi:lipopolysaccharide biosynthesis protein